VSLDPSNIKQNCYYVHLKCYEGTAAKRRATKCRATKRRTAKCDKMSRDKMSPTAERRQCRQCRKCRRNFFAIFCNFLQFFCNFLQFYFYVDDESGPDIR
jgi:hypothetical protein